MRSHSASYTGDAAEVVLTCVGPVAEVCPVLSTLPNRATWHIMGSEVALGVIQRKWRLYCRPGEEVHRVLSTLFNCTRAASYITSNLCLKCLIV